MCFNADTPRFPSNWEYWWLNCAFCTISDSIKSGENRLCCLGLLSCSAHSTETEWISKLVYSVITHNGSLLRLINKSFYYYYYYSSHWKRFLLPSLCSVNPQRSWWVLCNVFNCEQNKLTFPFLYFYWACSPCFEFRKHDRPVCHRQDGKVLKALDDRKEMLKFQFCFALSFTYVLIVDRFTIDLKQACHLLLNMDTHVKKSPNTTKWPNKLRFIDFMGSIQFKNMCENFPFIAIYYKPHQWSTVKPFLIIQYIYCIILLSLLRFNQ